MTELNVRPSEVGGRAKRDIAWLMANTFFLDRNGLNIVEPAEAAGAAAQSAKVVNLGSWSDADPTGLELHEPEATDIVITFESLH